MHIGNGNPEAEYTLGGTALPSVNSFKDLGIVIHSGLKSSLHCHKIAARALQRVGLIFRVFSCRVPSILLKAYTVFIRPLLESCTPVWSPYQKIDIECIERVQHVFTLRLFQRCGLGYDVCYKNRCDFLELESLEMRRLRFDLLMCFKIVRGFLDMY